MTAAEVGFFEDYEGEEVIEIGIIGMGDAGERRSFSIQRSTYGPEEQDIQSGMDSYNVSNEQGVTLYGCLRSVRLSNALLALEFAAEDAEIFGISTLVEVDLGDSRVDAERLAGKLSEVLDWGSHEKRPELIGLGIAGSSSSG